MHTLDITSPFELIDGSEYLLVERDNGFVRLRNTATGKYREMHVAELARNVVGLQPDSSPSPREIENLEKGAQAKIHALADHITELLTGEPLPGKKPRPQYDPELHTQNARVAAKVEELQMLGKPASRATLMRKIAAFRQSGRAALIDRRALRPVDPIEQIDPIVLDELCAVIESYRNRSTPTARVIIQQTRINVMKKHRANAPIMPSDRSMYRYIELLTPGVYTTKSARTRRSAANRPKGKLAQRSASLPGAEVQVDSTTLDLFVRRDDGTAARPIITVMIDVATRSIIAHTILWVAATGTDHVGLLLRALTPAQNRPDNSAYRALLQKHNPQVDLLSSDERAILELQRPFIYPRRVMMDNGKDFISDVFKSALEKFHVEFTYSAPHTPTNKPHVERVIGTINRAFCASLPGYTGGSVENRGYKVEEEELVDIFMLHQLLDDWILNVYHNTPHSGLRDRVHPNIRMTPNDMVQQSREFTPEMGLALTRHTYIDVLPSVFAVISKTGVQSGNRQYDSSELNPYRGKPSTRTGPHARKWEVKIDRHNPHLAWVRSPENTWIECQLRNQNDGMYPHVPVRRPKTVDPARSAVATITAHIDGVPMHHPAPDPITFFQTDVTFEDNDLDDDDDDITPFNPHED